MRSWCFCDKNNKENLYMGAESFLLTPSGYIQDRSYNGYGTFGINNIFELVVDWNRNYLSTNNLIVPEPYKNLSKSEYNNLVNNYNLCRKIISLINDNYSDNKIANVCGKDWKILLGIELTKSDFQNASLKFPVKICKIRPKKQYNLYFPSLIDKNNGLKIMKVNEIDVNRIKNMQKIYKLTHKELFRSLENER